MVQRVCVTSTNPVKIHATNDGFSRVFPHFTLNIDYFPVDSGVGSQPMNDEDTFKGAANRVTFAQNTYPQFDFWVGLEGGVQRIGEDLAAFAWAVIRNRSSEGKARTAAFFLPKNISELVLTGVELGDANDRVFGQHNSKQKGGAVGLLTGGVLDRQSLYTDAIILALIPFR